MGLRHDQKPTAASKSHSFSKPLGEFDHLEPIGRVLDFSKGNNESQTLNRTRIGCILQRLLQFLIELSGIIGVHNESSRGEYHMMTRKDDLSEMATAILSAIEKARHLKLPTSAYILSMALLEVSQETDALESRPKKDMTR
jgi:hypothetical protein